MKKQAFTLVELIVVITIIAILGTISFISLQGYSKSARDSTRISDLSTMKTSLELFHLDAGKYPKATNSFDVIYSGSVIWEQGEFGSSTFKNVSRLDKLPIDPLTGKKYTYSVTKNNNEYQLGGIMETDEIVGVLNQVNAAETEARAVVEGNYNGVMFKTSTGTSCEVLTIPSIITNQEESDLLNILNSDGLVYNGKKNLPSNYSSSNFKVDGGFGFTTEKLVAYSDNDNCKPLYDSKDSSARLELINGLQEAYSGTVISSENTISKYLNVDMQDSIALNELANSVINNSLGGNLSLDIKKEEEVIPPLPTSCTSGEFITYNQAIGNKDEIFNNINNYKLCKISDYPGGENAIITGTSSTFVLVSSYAHNSTSGVTWDNSMSICENKGLDTLATWLVPSIGEITTMYNVLGYGGEVGFNGSFYWTRNEVSSTIAYRANPGSGGSIYIYDIPKTNNSIRTRCISRF